MIRRWTMSSAVALMLPLTLFVGSRDPVSNTRSADDLNAEPRCKHCQQPAVMQQYLFDECRRVVGSVPYCIDHWLRRDELQK